MMDTNQAYKDKRATLLQIKSDNRAILDVLQAKKDKMMEVALRTVKLAIEDHFLMEYGLQQKIAQGKWMEAVQELYLLLCPQVGDHATPKDQKWRCDLCGYCWDDTPDSGQVMQREAEARLVAKAEQDAAKVAAAAIRTSLKPSP